MLCLRLQTDLRIVQRDVLGHQDLAFDDVDAGDDFGHRVLDLDARIDLDEIEFARVGVDQKLDRAGTLVAHACGRCARAALQISSRSGRIEIQRRRDLDHFLIAPLHRAVALEQMDQVAVLVADQLHFDVPRPGDELFQKDFGAAEGRLRFALGLLERRPPTLRAS